MKLAIKGHPTKGNKVIEILEMLGGTNVYHHKGGDSCVGYTVEENEIRTIHYIFGDEDFKFLSIEEFLEKYLYKTGDKVITNDSDKFIGTITDIRWQGDSFFVGKEGGYIVYKVQVSTTEQINYQKEQLQPYKEETMEEIKVDIPKGYEFAGVDDDKQQVVFTKIEILSQYPKTYEECCKVLGSDPSKIIVLSNRKDIIHEENKHCYEMYNLYQLLICRDAYWKLYGEQTGLGKPWEPNWNDGDEEKYCIEVRSDDELCDITYLHVHRILAFPTMELLDIFGEYFKDLIESCKELL